MSSSSAAAKDHVEPGDTEGTALRRVAFLERLRDEVALRWRGTCSGDRGAPSSSRNVLVVAILAFAALLSLVSFLPAMGGEFVWDDIYLVRDNATLRNPMGWWVILTKDLWGGAGQQATQLYHPIPMLSLWGQTMLHGSSLIGYQLANWLLHLLCGWLLWRIAGRLGVGKTLAACFASVFLLHPLAVEPVMWITGRHDCGNRTMVNTQIGAS